MRKFRQRNAMVRTLGLRLLTVVLLILLIGLLRGVWDVYQKERETRENRAAATKELAELSGREKELRAEVARLKTDRGIEAELRQQFEVAKEGEELIVIVERPASENEVKEEKQAWWQVFWPW